MKTPVVIYNQRGTAVETAIIFMLLMMLLFGIIEFGLLLLDKHILTNASREGARAGIVVGLDRSQASAFDGMTEENIPDSWYQKLAKNEALDFCAAYLVSLGTSSSPPNVSVSLDDVDGNGIDRGDILTVSLTYSYKFLIPSVFGLEQLQLDAVSTMQLE